MVMHRRIIENDNSQWHTLFTSSNPVDQFCDVWSFDGMTMTVIPETTGVKLQGANHIDALSARTGVGRMRFAFGRPSSLHIRDIGKTAFVQIEQAQLVGERRCLQALQVILRRLEAFGVAFFFSDNRVRVNDKPRFFR